MITQILNLLDTQEERNSFFEMYERYKNLLYYLAYNKTHNTLDAEDCVQETFAYVAENFDKIDDINSSRTKGFLCTVVVGYAIKLYNKSKKQIFISTNDDNDTVDTEYFEKYNSIELSEAMDTVLDDESRIYLNMKYIYGYKSKEIAEMYNTSDANVRKKNERALKKLRQFLGERD